MIKIEIYTDGSCTQAKEKGEGGPGGWSFLILENGTEKIKKSGSEKNTTNNKCELLGVIKALEELDAIDFFEDIEVTVISDSAYIVNAFADNWISKWNRNGWINSKKEPVANKDYWDKLIPLQKKYNVLMVRIKRRSNKHAIQVDNMAKNPLVD